jgi:hypothetical protein
MARIAWNQTVQLVEADPDDADAVIVLADESTGEEVAVKPDAWRKLIAAVKYLGELS